LIFGDGVHEAAGKDGRGFGRTAYREKHKKVKGGSMTGCRGGDRGLQDARVITLRYHPAPL
jgi:hypothetical protein